MPSDPLAVAVMGGTWTDEHEQTVRLVQGYLGRFTYKPGWHFEVVRRPELSLPVSLRVSASQIDSRSVDGHGPARCRPCEQCGGVRGVRIPVEGLFPVPLNLLEMTAPEKCFYDFLRNTIIFVERHEADEWMRVDGELPFDPHKNDFGRKL